MGKLTSLAVVARPGRPRSRRAVTTSRELGYVKICKQFVCCSSKRVNNGRSATVLLEMERLSEQHGVVVSALAGREELHRCHLSLRGPDLQSAQDGAVGV